MRTAILILAAALAGCAHEWTPEQRAALRERRATECRPATSQGGPCRTVWQADQGRAMPPAVERGLSGRTAELE